MERWLREQIDLLRTKNLLREPHPPPAASALIDAATNDYLGLAGAAVSRETLNRWPNLAAGAGASRLVYGTQAPHEALEQALSHWVATPEALCLGSAYAANVGVIPALAAVGDLVISDELNHASIVDGCRLSRAEIKVVPHLELAAIEQTLRSRRPGTRALVVTEALFSMDGDAPDVAELRLLCDRYDAALIVDESHSLGVFGPEGAGRLADTGVRADVLVGGLGKAVGAQGGFVAGSAALRTWLWNRARPFVFSTAISPVLCGLLLLQIERCRAAETARLRLGALGKSLREELGARGVPTNFAAVGPIVPVLLGESSAAVEAAAKLRDQGFLVQAIRPPSVADGTARLRLTVHASWSSDVVPRLAAALERVCAA
jgi:8-amino-7-oxononanoate synthase